MPALLAFRGLQPSVERHVLSIFRKQNARAAERTFRAGEFTVHVTGDCNRGPLVYEDERITLAAAGIPYYRGQFNARALELLGRDMKCGEIDEFELGGAFAAVLIR